MRSGFLPRILLVAAPLASGVSAASPRIEQGVAFSNLAWRAPDQRHAIIDDIARSGATWLRDGPTGGSPAAIAAFVDAMAYAEARGLKTLIVLVPRAEDYQPRFRRAENGGEAFRKRCGWPHGSLRYSRIDLGLYTARLRRLLAALKAAKVTPAAFEIGNEVDWICFNGDVPDGRAATPGELDAAALAYGRFLRASALAIRAAGFTPRAKIVTGGLANVSGRWDTPPHHLEDAASFLQRLRKVGGSNYLANQAYAVDGIGIHLYPAGEDPVRYIPRELDRLRKAVGPTKPLWVTEWGLPSGADAAKQVRPVRVALQSTGRLMPLGPAFHYVEDWAQLRLPAPAR